MKYVIEIPQYRKASFRVIGLFDSEKSGHKFVEDYFQDEPDYRVVPYDEKVHGEIMEDIPESYQE